MTICKPDAHLLPHQ